MNLESISYVVEKIRELIHKDKKELEELLEPIKDKKKESESSFGEIMEAVAYY